MSRRRKRGIAPLVFIMLVATGSLAGTLLSGSSPELGLDLQGGVSVVMQPKGDAPSDALDQAKEIISTRVDALGIAEPRVTRQGQSIIVQLPGVKNQARALELVGQTAELRFRPVLQAGAFPVPESETTSTTAEGGSTTTTAGDGATTTTADGSSTSTTSGSTSTSEAALGGLHEGELAAPILPLGEDTTTSTSAAGSTTTTKADASSTTSTSAEGEPSTTTSILTPSQDELNDLCPVLEPEQDVATEQVYLPELDDDGNLTNCFLLAPSALTGTALSTAAAKIDPQGRWYVSPVFKGGENGIDLFNLVAAQCQPPSQTCPTGQVAIVLDGVVKSAPTIQQAQFERDQITITGDFTEREAKDLALVLKYGALPIELEPQTVQTVSASLGKDSLNAGLLAGLGGLLLVALYMILYYRALGFVVIFGLGVWAALSYSLITFLSETQGLALTLSGVTGLVISIGVTVDTYVVYFERLKDEVRAGRTLRSSTERAFKRAFRTVLAANITSFIGAALLYWLTVGPVRGFAFFLGVATVLDVVVAWFFIRPLVAILGRSRLFTEAKHLGVARGLGQRTTPASAAP